MIHEREENGEKYVIGRQPRMNFGRRSTVGLRLN